MKKNLFISIAVLMMSCTGKFGRAGDNASQYVREQMPELVKDAESVEAVEEAECYLINIDSCLYTIVDSKSSDRIDKMKFASILSIHSSEKYLNEAKQAGLTDRRKTFLVTITQKSSKKQNVIVIMEPDGCTPSMTLDEYNERLKPLEERMEEYFVDIVDTVDVEIGVVTE